MKTIVHVIGARPNFMKVAPVIVALRDRAVCQRLVHTGQHYDANMSDVFFRELGLPAPDLNLEVGSGSHAVQTAQILIRFEQLVHDQRPDLVLVYGDVNSTVAAALVCAKLRIPVGHVEAGLRSGDRSMPEEINRLLTDQLADLLFTPSADGDQNLAREGIPASKVHLVGNVMVDTLLRLLPAADTRWGADRLAPWRNGPYALVTLHRPSNVDDPRMLRQIVEALADVATELPVIFPVHPRTRQQLADLAQATNGAALSTIDPLSYLDFLALQRRATVVITDSGGIQEETTVLGVPCLTVRENTERPITVTMGTNTLVGRDLDLLRAEVRQILAGGAKRGRVPPLWDGHAAERVATVVAAAC